MKWIIRILFLVVILIGLLIFGGYLALDGVVKSVVEKEGSEQLKVRTTLDGVNLGLIKGTVNLSGFALGSPTGFSEPKMFSVGKLSVDTGGVMRLRNQPIHVAAIVINEPRLVIEQHGKKLNFRELMDHLPSHPDDKNKPATTDNKPPVKLVIDSLSISNAHVLLHSDIPGLTKEIDVPLPEMKMMNVGNADGTNNGAAIKDVATAVITRMIDQATKSGGFPIDIQGLLNGNLDEVKDKLTEAAQKQLSVVKIPSQVNGLLNQLSGKQSGSSNTASDAAADLINKGFRALKGATSKP